MGPSLMDDEWIYGDRLEQIHQTLVEGRPNGMPSWGGKIPGSADMAAGGVRAFDVIAGDPRGTERPDTVAIAGSHSTRCRTGCRLVASG